MEAPQITFICLMGVSFGIELARHGQQKTGTSATHNVWIQTISTVLTVAVLWWGGFWQ